MGKSFSVSCSCKLIVCVDTMAFFFSAMANRIAGMRYASDLPTPVPASTARCSRLCSARATATAISCCCGRNSKFFARDKMPVGENISSTCAIKSVPLGWTSAREIIATAHCAAPPSTPPSGPARGKADPASRCRIRRKPFANARGRPNPPACFVSSTDSKPPWSGS